jgi:hypothetical protein
LNVNKGTSFFPDVQQQAVGGWWSGDSDCSSASSWFQAKELTAKLCTSMLSNKSFAWTPSRLESLEIARRWFRKFNSKYIESIKIAHRRSSARCRKCSLELHNLLQTLPACMTSLKFSVTGKTFPKCQTKIIK